MINVITGFGNVSGSILSHHMDVRALSFTGSGRTGRIVQEAAAKSNLKQVFLELGGKSPAVIFEDADVQDAVKQTAHSIQWNSGQVCMANSRVYVQDTIAEKFVQLFKENFEKEVAIGKSFLGYDIDLPYLGHRWHGLHTRICALTCSNVG